jgi:signal transduction histidine kinase
MTRRIWPVALALATLVILGSYLAVTQYLFRAIKAQNAISSKIFSEVQRGLLSDDGTNALLEINGMLGSIGLPIVVFNAEGEPYAAINVPGGEVDLANHEDRQRVREFASRVERRRPANSVPVAGAGRFVFGEPPLMDWLRWVPWLTVTGGTVLVLVAVAIIRADMRAERERLWAAMARELAHQMGTPLSSLAGWIEVLGMPEQERQNVVTNAHIADVIAVDLERLERVSRRFELIGKPSALQPVALADVVAELQTYFTPRLPKLGRGIRLRTRCQPGLPEIRANRVLLVWALENVVKNAVDALAGRGGHILIVAHAEPANGSVHVHIADNGPGISPEVRDRIFEPGVTTKAGGWGVGLSLTRRIVEQLHGGRVTVQNRRRGGTVFDVTLPASGTRGHRWFTRR